VLHRVAGAQVVPAPAPWGPAAYREAGNDPRPAQEWTAVTGEQPPAKSNGARRKSKDCSRNLPAHTIA